MKRFLLLRVLSVFVLLLLLPAICEANIVSGQDLFLAPSAVATDHYATTYLTFNTALNGYQNTYGASQLVSGGCSGCLLTGIGILPLLAPNPVTIQGDYHPYELLNITDSTHFAYQPEVGTGYWADLTTASAVVNYNDAGMYYVQLTGTDSTGQITYKRILLDRADDVDGGNNTATGVERKQSTTSTPSGDLVITSKGDPLLPGETADNNYLDNARKIYDKAGKAHTDVGSVDDALKAIDKAYKDNGNKPVSVVIVAHGFPGGLWLNNDQLTDGGTMSGSDFYNKIKDKVKELTLYGCQTGEGTDGETFIKDISGDKKLKVNFFKEQVTAGFQDAKGNSFFDLPAGAVMYSTPEPGTLLLLGTGLAGAARLFRRKRIG